MEGFSSAQIPLGQRPHPMLVRVLVFDGKIDDPLSGDTVGAHRSCARACARARARGMETIMNLAIAICAAIFLTLAGLNLRHAMQAPAPRPAPAARAAPT